MGFLKRLLGLEAKDQPYVDKDGVYLYVLCDNCGTPVRVRADKQYDLVNESGRYSWHKTIVDNRCFRPMPTVVRFNTDYEVVEEEITGGRYITEEEYNALLAGKAATDQSGDDLQNLS
jgi:hypothetical protein